MTTSNAGLYGPEAILSQTGVPATTTPVTVYLHGTSTAATLYSNATESGTVSNPINTDSFGNLSFWATPGLYTLSFTVGGIATTKLVLVNPWWVDSVVNVGVILMTGGSTPDTGYLICDGSAVNRTTYAKLFARIGTTYGVGNGTTTFNLPDLRGKVGVGYKTGTGTFGTLGATKGATHYALVQANIPKHSVGSGITDSGHQHSTDATGNTAHPAFYGIVTGGSTFTTGGTGQYYQATGAKTGVATTGISFGHTTPTSVPIVQPSLVVNYQIKV